jgi:hypothetical protein
LTIEANSVASGAGEESYHTTSDGLFLGASDFSSAPFSVSMAGALKATSADISGKITATTGEVGGWTILSSTLSSTNMVLDSGNERISVGASSPLLIDGANKKIESSNYVSGIFGSGFHLDENLFEVGNIACRGLIRTAVFQKDAVNVMGGNFVVLDGDVLDADMTALDASTMTTKANTTFAVGDILRIKDGIDDEWLEVTNIASAPTYTVTRDKASSYDPDNNPAWQKGVTIVNYGQSGEGGVYMTASDSNAPYISIFDHAGSPWTTINTRLRLGNLNGYLGYSSNLYGIGIGTTGNSMSYDVSNGLRITGTITGGTVQTATTGERVVMTGNKIYTYDSDNNITSYLNGDGANASLLYLRNINSSVVPLRVDNEKNGNDAFNVYNSTATTGYGILVGLLNAGGGGTGQKILHAGTSGYGLYIENSNASFTGNTLYVKQAGVNASAMVSEATGGACYSAVQNTAVSTNFKKIFTFGSTMWWSNGVTPNGALSGTAGDFCVNCDSGKMYYCTGTTNWTAM